MRMKMDRVIIRLEPSKRLSEILGYPYYTEKSIPFSEISSILTEVDIEAMKNGDEIMKQMPVRG